MKDLAGPERGPGTPVRRSAATRAVRASVVARTGNAARLGPRIAAQLQTQIGNRAVARLVAQRSAGAVGETETPAPPVNRTDVPVQRLRPGPESDPKFRAVTRDVRAKQHRLAAHPPAKAEAARAQGAAKPPPDDKQAHGKAAQAEKMNAAKPGDFDKAGFIAAVNAAIAKKAPQTLSEARDFGSSGKADAIKGEVAGKVSASKKASSGAIETTTKAAPDTSQVKDKTVTELVADRPPPTPGTPNPAQAVPDKAPPEDTDFSAGPKQVDGAMADAQVTEEQLARSNEPEFTGALADKKSGEEHSATAPGQLRASEAQTLRTAKAGAAASGATAMASMALGRRTAGAAVAGGKQAAKTTDETRRAEVAATLQKVFDATKTEVEAILTGIDGLVTTAFDTGEKVARDAFTSEHTQKMEDYKDRRYSGIRGKARWIRDKFKGLPAEANQIFVTARQGYVEKMKQVISSVADLIGGELGRAKKRIAQGREELQTEVRRLPKDLQAIGKQAAGEFSEKFDSLTESVNDKGSELVETLASRYTEALGKVDEEIDAEKEKNKGLIAKAIDAVVGVIKTILQLKDLLLGVLAKAAQAAMAIISDPIGFLGNLVSAVGAGLSAFMTNIGDHLQKGLVSWLLGSASSMGIQLPEKFDLRGILMMIASMLGLTWDTIKARVIGRGVPAQAIEAAEGSMPLIAKLRSEGIGAAWEDIKERVGDLKETLFSKITEYLVPAVLTAGITWIISLLNPASAFIKACKMIIDIVTFIVTRGAQIIEFVNSVLDAVIAIAAGGAGGVPALIENALAKSIPVLIGALAAILGVSGIADKVKSIIQSLAKPITKAVDWITDKIVGVGKKVWGKIKSAGRTIKDKAVAGAGRLRDRVLGPRKDNKPDASAPAPAGPAFHPLHLTFDMSGASHTIDAGAADAEMHSPHGGALLAKVQRARSAPGLPADQVADLTVIEQRVREFRALINLHSRHKTEVPDGAAEVTALLAAIRTYATRYQARDIDPFEASAASLRQHDGYAWLAGRGLADPMEARIFAHLDDFGPGKIKKVLDVIKTLGGHAAFEAKVRKAVERNAFWSPNHGFFFEIGDLRSIADIKFFDVPVRGKEIDTLTASGQLIDQKYAVNVVDAPGPGGVVTRKLKLASQAGAMAAAAASGDVVSGITVTSWQIHYVQPLTAEAVALIAAAGWTGRFVQGTDARSYL